MLGSDVREMFVGQAVGREVIDGKIRGDNCVDFGWEMWGGHHGFAIDPAEYVEIDSGKVNRVSWYEGRCSPLYDFKKKGVFCVAVRGVAPGKASRVRPLLPPLIWEAISLFFLRSIRRHCLPGRVDEFIDTLTDFIASLAAWGLACL